MAYAFNVLTTTDRTYDGVEHVTVEVQETDVGVADQFEIETPEQFTVVLYQASFVDADAATTLDPDMFGTPTVAEEIGGVVENQTASADIRNQDDARMYSADRKLRVMSKPNDHANEIKTLITFAKGHIF